MNELEKEIKEARKNLNEILEISEELEKAICKLEIKYWKLFKKITQPNKEKE